MRILVNGEERELRAVTSDGIEWTGDLLGDYDDLHYDRETDDYTMSEEAYAWWEVLIDKLNQINELEDELDDEARSEYIAGAFDGPDLESETDMRLKWLKSH